jgi:hypothetical protein
LANTSPAAGLPSRGSFRQSRGIAPPVLIAAIISLAIVFLQGGFTVVSSGIGRVWPSTDSTKIDLGSDKIDFGKTQP